MISVRLEKEIDAIQKQIKNEFENKIKILEGILKSIPKKSSALTEIGTYDIFTKDGLAQALKDIEGHKHKNTVYYFKIIEPNDEKTKVIKNAYKAAIKRLSPYTRGDDTTTKRQPAEIDMCIAPINDTAKNEFLYVGKSEKNLKNRLSVHFTSSNYKTTYSAKIGKVVENLSKHGGLGEIENIQVQIGYFYFGENIDKKTLYSIENKIQQMTEPILGSYGKVIAKKK